MESFVNTYVIIDQLVKRGKTNPEADELRRLLYDHMEYFKNTERDACSQWPTQAEAARIAGVTPGHMSRLVAGGKIKTDTPCDQLRVEPTSLLRYVQERDQRELRRIERRLDN